MNSSIEIPKGSADEFLNRLKAQCLPFEKRPFVPDGRIYFHAENRTFLLYTAAGLFRESWLMGILHEEKVSWSFGIRPFIISLLILSISFAWLLALIKGVPTDTLMFYAAIFTAMGLGSYFATINISERLGQRSRELVEQTAKVMLRDWTPPQAPLARCGDLK